MSVRAPFTGTTLLLAALAAAEIPAQEPVTLSGLVVDQNGAPVAGLEVLLHRLAGQAGDRIGQTLSAEDGTFTLTIEGEQPAGAIFFATTRYQGQVFTGPFLEPPIEPGLAYELVVGGEPVSFGATTVPTGASPEVRPPASPRRWALALIPLLAVLGAGAVALARRTRRTRRGLLVRLAVLEEEIAASGETEGLRRERARILDQLGGSAAS